MIISIILYRRYKITGDKREGVTWNFLNLPLLPISCESVGLDAQSKGERFFCTCRFMLKRTNLKKGW